MSADYKNENVCALDAPGPLEADEHDKLITGRRISLFWVWAANRSR